jgi:hypothetical protein
VRSGRRKRCNGFKKPLPFMGRGFFIMKAVVNFISRYTNSLLQMNQGENEVWEMIKEGFHVREKGFFVDEILNLSKPLVVNRNSFCGYKRAI